MIALRWHAPSGYEMWAVEAITQRRVRLWYRVSPADVWELGHSKEVPEGKSAKWVISQMQKYTCGVISQAEYNTIPD